MQGIAEAYFVKGLEIITLKIAYGRKSDYRYTELTNDGNGLSSKAFISMLIPITVLYFAMISEQSIHSASLLGDP